MRLRSALPYGFIMAISLFFGYLLSRAYPYGIPHADTGTYLEFGQTFSFFHANPGDWIRTPPFPLLLRFSLFTHEPTFTVLWFYLLLFTGNIALTFWFFLGIFPSRILSFVVTSVALIFEVSLMRTFYYSIQILADPLLAHFVLTGSLLALGGWIRRSPLALLVGAAFLGLAAFTKPVGIVLFPLWIPFYIWAVRDNGKSHTLTVLCIALLLGPTLLWSGRNTVLYGYFQPTAFGGRNLLPRVLPLLEDTDTILSDPQKNSAFIEEVRAVERTVGTEYNHYAWGVVPNRIGYWGILDTLTEQYRETGESLATLGMRWNAGMLDGRFFAIDSLTIRTALRIIAYHPWEYLNMVTRDYWTLFKMRHRILGISYQLQAPPQETYQWIPRLQESMRKKLYPPSGLSDADHISPRARAILSSLVLTLPPASTNSLFSFASLTHALFLGSLVVLFRQRHRKNPVPFHAALSIVMLFLTAASHYALTSATELPLERYALPGEMGLNLIILLATFLLIS